MSDLTDPKPPARPWKKGKHGTHDVVVVEVEICQDEFMRVFSTHKLQTEGDTAVALSWAGGGQRQVAHALLTEALRREATVGFLVKLTQDNEYLTKLAAMEPEAHAAELEALAEAMLGTVGKTSHKMALAIVKDALSAME